MTKDNLPTIPGTARSSRREDSLATAEAKLGAPVAMINQRANAIPDFNFSEFSVPQKIDEALARNRDSLASLPDQAEVERLAAIAREALAVCSPSIVAREVANLIGSFPSAAIADPEIYASALIFDVMDKRIPDAVLVLACRRVRRAEKFVPAISEVLAAAESILNDWRSLEALPDVLPATRAALEEAVRRGEKILALVRQEIAEGFRDQNGRILRQRWAYRDRGAA